MIDDDNPYAAPKAEILGKDTHFESAADAWRDRELLVVRKGAELTDRCLKCAAPTKGYRDQFSRMLSWHKPAWAALILVNWLLYLIVYFIVRWQGRVTVSLCPLHRKKRRRAITWGWLAALSGIGTIIAAVESLDSQRISDFYFGIGMAAGFVLILGGLIGGMLGSRVLVPKRMDRNFIWLSKVSPDYLAALPDWNAPGD